MGTATRTVVNFMQSPLNAQRYQISLSCGCEVWQTRKRKPTVGAKFALYPHNWECPNRTYSNSVEVKK